MQSAKVEKLVLIKTLETNREKHREEYVEAEDSYRKSVIEWYEKQMQKAEEGEEFETYYEDEVAPVDHTSDYENILAMLQYTIDTEIQLTQQEFRQYVQDDWHWQGEFKMSASYYNTKVGKFAEGA